jgi:hypothetical protein
MGQVMGQETWDENQEVMEYQQVDYIPHDPACKVVTLRNGKPYFIPMICWKIETSTILDRWSYVSVAPVTTDGTESNLREVLFPDGSVRHGDQIYDTLEDWLKAALEEEAANAKSKEKE